MNVVSRVTVRHLKQNRKRTIVTVLGIMLSVALITAISAFAESFLDMMRQSVIADGGEWHVTFYDVEKSAVPQITGDSNVKKSLCSRDVGNALLPEGDNPFKPYIIVKSYDSEAMKEYPTTLIEGRYPEAPDELVISNHMLEDHKVSWEVGDTVSLELGKRFDDQGEEVPSYYGYGDGEKLEPEQEISYTIVGVIERPDFENRASASYTALTYLDMDSLADQDTVNVAVQVRSLNNGIFQWGDAKAKELGVTDDFNTSLLSYYMLSGNNTMVSMLNTVKWVMMLIVAAGSVAVIYSSFAISISERSRYLGMLASVGATRKQKRQSVITEALILGVIGIPLGILLGFAGVFVTTRCIRGLVSALAGDAFDNVTMRVIVSWRGILGAVILAAVTIFISAWIPAARAARISPVEAIRQNRDIRLTSRQVKTSRLTRIIFGFEGELALKNLKRNKKRYRATVLSLIFCIALYLSVTSFTAYLKDAYTMQTGIDSVNLPDVMVTVYTGKEGETALSRAGKIAEMDPVSEAVINKRVNMSFFPDDLGILSDSVETGIKNLGNYEEDGQEMNSWPLSVNIIGLDEKSLKEFGRKTGADPEILEEGGVILLDRFMEEKDGKSSWEHVWNLENGDVINGLYVNYSTEEDGEGSRLRPLELTVAGVTEELPLGGKYSADINSVYMYTTMDKAMTLCQEVYGNTEESLEVSITAENYDALMEKLWDLADKDGNLGIYSVREEIQSINNMLLLLNVFVYGFIILTALICVTSIFNTISTSVELRRREYAMLKSVGMDPGRFGRMIAYESLFYGLKALIYGLPLGLVLMYGIYRSIASAIEAGFYVLWGQMAVAVVSVLLVVGITMWYSFGKIQRSNIVDVLKDENI